MTSAIGVAVLSQFAAPASAASLINETFGSGLADSLNIPAGTTVGTTGTLKVGVGNVDLIGDGGRFNPYSGNGNYIDLNGNTLGSITSIATYSASTFANGGTLTFSYGANGTSKATVSIGTSFLGTVAPSPGSFNTLTYIVPNNANGVLTFLSSENSNSGIILDSIVLNSNDSPAAAVPEPFTMIGTLVGGTAAIRLRKKLKVDSNV